MLHFAGKSGQVNQILDNQGIISGAQIFDAFTFDGTTGGSGQTQQMSLYLYNDDTNYLYNTIYLSIYGTVTIEQKTWFTLLDDENVAGAVPTQQEWTTYGAAGTSTLAIPDVGAASSLPPNNPPERKFWIRCAVPAGITSANLTALSLRVQAVQEAV